MEKKNLSDRVIEQYIKDEKMMILLFAQWCRNNELDAFELYALAYPNQLKNPELSEAIENTVSKEESLAITSSIVMEALQLFGNDDLAFVVNDVQMRINKQ